MVRAYDVSRIFQRELERQLAGMALGYPLMSLDYFPQLEGMMIDKIALEYLRTLNRRRGELEQLEEVNLIGLTSAIAMQLNPCAILRGFSDAAPTIYGQMTIEEIAADLARRIELQHIFRVGLCELQEYTTQYIDDTYVQR